MADTEPEVIVPQTYGEVIYMWQENPTRLMCNGRPWLKTAVDIPPNYLHWKNGEITIAPESINGMTKKQAWDAFCNGGVVFRNGRDGKPVLLKEPDMGRHDLVAYWRAGDIQRMENHLHLSLKVPRWTVNDGY